MNCKPGDLAYVRGCISEPEINGRVVEVLHAAPPHDYLLPDGTLSIRPKNPRPAWAVKFSSPKAMKWSDGKVRNSLYATCVDTILLPIRDPGEDARDQTLDWLPVPSKEGETA